MLTLLDLVPFHQVRSYITQSIWFPSTRIVVTPGLLERYRHDQTWLKYMTRLLLHSCTGLGESNCKVHVGPHCMPVWLLTNYWSSWHCMELKAIQTTYICATRKDCSLEAGSARSVIQINHQFWKSWSVHWRLILMLLTRQVAKLKNGGCALTVDLVVVTPILHTHITKFYKCTLRLQKDGSNITTPWLYSKGCYTHTCMCMISRVGVSGAHERPHI